MARRIRCGRLVGFVPILLMNSVLAAPAASLDIKNLTLEELMDIDVYSASRRLEPLQGIASAAYVITSEDIRRSRAQTLPEVLRLVPGVHVARVDASRWAVSIRGFNERITHNIQVLIDGRSVYDPLFAGTFWEMQDTLLEDIERIEVVRGPGGTLWGANAVNGVINIITKNAANAQGGLVTAGAGTEERAFGAARYGWQAGDKQYARVYAKSFDRGPGFTSAPSPKDQTTMTRTGFRWDAQPKARDAFMVSGDFFEGQAGQILPGGLSAQHIGLSGGHLLARWERHYSSIEGMRLQFSYDHTGQDADFAGLDERRNTYDLDFQQSAQFTPNQLTVWGVGYRRTRDLLTTMPAGVVSPQQRSDASVNVFLQDTITLSPERWFLTLGTKVENTDYSHAEWQPNVRLSWTPTADETWWAAVSRAVRVPSRLEHDLLGGTGFGDRFAPEDVLAYELGQRSLVNANFWYDIAAFYNVYNNLRNFEPISTFPFVQLQNFMQGRTYGVGIGARWQATPSLRLDAAYTYLQMQLEIDPASSASASQAATINESSPTQQLVLRSAYTVAPRWEFDATLRFVDKLRALAIPAYTSLDLGIGWHPYSNVELALVGQNLLDSHHPEQIFESSNGVGTEVERGMYTKLTWKF